MRYILFVLCCLCVVYACYEDKGNYDYIGISEVKADSIKGSYRKIAFKDTLFIQPEVSSSSPDDRFEYLWTIYSNGNKNEKGEVIVDTIAYSRNLEYPVNLRPGNYRVVFRLTNVTDSREIFKSTLLKVETEFSRGFYVLKEKDGKGELDLHLPDGGVMTGLLEKSNVIMPGKPKSLGICPSYSFINKEKRKLDYATTLNLCSEQNFRMLSTSDLREIYSFDEMFYGEIPQDMPLCVSPYEYGAYYFSDKGIYTTFYVARPDHQYMNLSSGKFGLKTMVSGSSEIDYLPAPHIAVVGKLHYFFDQMHGRFLCLDWNGNINCFDDGENPAYSVNGIPHKLKYLGRCKVQFKNRGFAVFEDADHPELYYLYFLKFASMSYSNPIQNVTALSKSSPLVQASLYACNELDAFVVYCVKDNKLYAHYVEDNRVELCTTEGLDKNEEIVYLSNIYWTLPSDGEYTFNYLVIGTCKEERYKLYMYEMLGAKPYGKPVKILEGEGKIVGLQYVSPKMNQAYHDYISLSFN